MNTATETMSPLHLHGRIANDLVWAMQWLDSLVDDLNTEHHDRTGHGEHHRVREFLDDLAQRRTQSTPLDYAYEEATR
jgi:hypothetical protein